MSSPQDYGCERCLWSYAGCKGCIPNTEDPFEAVSKLDDEVRGAILTSAKEKSKEIVEEALIDKKEETMSKEKEKVFKYMLVSTEDGCPINSFTTEIALLEYVRNSAYALDEIEVYHGRKLNFKITLVDED